MNIYETASLVMAIQGIDPSPSFLADRYFPTNDATDIFKTEKVLVESRDGNRILAPFTSPNGGPVIVGRQGQRMKEYTPPTVAPGRELTIADLQKRGFGETILPNTTPAQRAQMLALRDLDELDAMIARREEQMAGEVMTTNGCVMLRIDDDLSVTVDDVLKFYEGDDNPAQIAFDESWDDPQAPVLKHLADMVRAQTAIGMRATELVCAPDVADAVINNEGVQKMLDNRRINIGEAAPKLEAPGAAVVCTLNINGHMVDVISYDETYVDYAGKVKAYIPDGTCVLTAPGAGRKFYGAVTQIEDDGEYHTWPRRRVPRVLVDKDNNTKTIAVTSRPLLVPAEKRPFLAAKAVFE